MRWIARHLRLLAGASIAVLIVLVVMGQSPITQWQSVQSTINQIQQALSTMISNPLTSPLNANSQSISNVTTLGYTAYTVATLPAEVDGKSAFASDGTPGSSPCTGGGTGAIAAGENGHWACLGGSTVPSGTNAQLLGYANGTNSPTAFSISGDLGLSSSYAATVNTVLGGKTPVTTLNNAMVSAATAAGNVIVQGQNGAQLSTTTGGIAVGSVGAYSSVITPVSTCVIPAPSTIASGHVEVALIALDQTTTAVSVTPPAGWTLVRQDVVSNNSAASLIYYHVAGGSEPASYTFTLANTKTCRSGIADLTGVDTINPIDASAGTNSLNGGVLSLPATTTTSQNDTVLVIGAINATAGPSINYSATSTITAANGNNTATIAWRFPIAGEIPAYTFGSVGVTSASTVTEVALKPSATATGSVVLLNSPATFTSDIANGTPLYSGAANPMTGYSHDGYYNVVAYGADPTGTIDSTANIQAAEVAACAGTGLNGAIPTVFFPAGTYNVFSGPVVDNCASNVTFAGVAGGSASVLNGHQSGTNTQEPIILAYPSTYLSGLGTLTAAPLVGSTGNSLNFPSGNGVYYNLNDVMLGSSPNPLNGLSAFTIEFYVNTSSLAGFWFDSLGPGTANAARIWWGSALKGTVDIGGTPQTVSQSITSGTTEWVALQYSSSTGTLSLYVCTPNQASCAPATVTGLTGNLVQAIGETMTLGEGAVWPDGGNAAEPFTGEIYSFRISKTARYSGTLANAPNAAFTSDANTLVLINGDKFNSTYGLMGTDTPGSGSILVPRGNSSLGSSPTIRDMTLTSAAQGVMMIESPGWVMRDVTISSMSKAGIDAYNNSFSGVADNIHMTSPGVIGLENDSSSADEVAYNFQETGGYYGLVNPEAVYKMIWTPSASGLVGVYWNTSTSTEGGNLCSDCLMDVEAGGSAVPFQINSSGGGAFQIIGGDMQTASGGDNAGVLISGNPQISIVGTHWEGSPTSSLGVLRFAASGATGARATWVNPTVNGAPWTRSSTIPISNQMGQTTIVSATELNTSNEATVTQASLPTRTTVSGATTLGAQSYQILTMTATATLTLPSGTYDGQKLSAKVCQNATGGFTPTWAGPISWPSGTAPTPTTTASKCDLYGWLWDATAATWNEAGFVPNE